MPPRKAFALVGGSVDLDPRTHAVRGDLADVRLAEHVFAPHYAAPMVCVFRTAVDLLVARDRGSEIMASMQPGDLFEVLELAGANAWGVAPAHNLVGYVDRDALDRCPT